MYTLFDESEIMKCSLLFNCDDADVRPSMMSLRMNLHDCIKFELWTKSFVMAKMRLYNPKLCDCNNLLDWSGPLELCLSFIM